MIFKYGLKKVLISNQLTIVKSDRRPKAKEAGVPMISLIPNDTFDS